MEIIHNIVGFAGSLLIVVAYFLLQMNRLTSNQLSYSLLNLVGASGIIFSLCFEFNWSAFFVEAFWVLISIIGIFNAFRHKANVSE